MEKCKNREMRFVWIVAVASVAGAQSIPKESYELYSAILKGENKCGGGRLEADEVVAISARADLPVDKLTEEANPVSPEDHELIREMIRANKEEPAWENRFDFGRPVRFLSDSEFGKAGECAYKEITTGECARFAGIKWARAFSVPGFNRDRTRAIVYFEYRRMMWGGLSFAEYRKRDGKWQRVEHGVVGSCWKF